MTTPAAPPISLQDVATELRRAGSGELNNEDVKRLAGVSRLATAVSLSQLLGKTRPYWGQVDSVVSGLDTGFSGPALMGSLAPQVDVYLGSVQIRQFLTTMYTFDSTVQTTLVFVADPGFRNDLKARLLDTDFGFIREVTLSYNAGSGTWRSPSLPIGSAAATLFTGAGSFQLDLIKL